MRKTLAKLTSILLFASIVLFVPSMTVFADEGDEGNTVITTDSTTNGYVADILESLRSLIRFIDSHCSVDLI